MADKSNYLKNAVVNVLRNTTLTGIATVYVALYTTDPTVADTGTEVSGGSYARQPVSFSAPSSGVTANSADVTFPVATANWGTITHIGLRDASSGGNLLYFKSIASVSISTTEQLKFPAGDIDLTES